MASPLFIIHWLSMLDISKARLLVYFYVHYRNFYSSPRITELYIKFLCVVAVHFRFTQSSSCGVYITAVSWRISRSLHSTNQIFNKPKSR